MTFSPLANELLGYPPDARLLIINNDDFGMLQSINEATIQTIKNGLASSCTLMAPCPWSLDALELLRQNPDLTFGVHLTAVAEQPHYKWRPLTAPEKVPSLIVEGGFFHSYDGIDEFVQQIKLKEIEQEFRAQIEFVLAAGVKPTHLDSHCHVHTRREDIFDMVTGFAAEYGLAMRVHMQPLIEKTRRIGLPANDHLVLDSYRLELEDKVTQYCDLLKKLPPGLSEWAIHPAIENAELKAMEPTWEVRKVDYNFLMSPRAKKVLEDEGITVINFKPLQEHWRKILNADRQAVRV